VLEFEKENSETISLIKSLRQMQIFSTATYECSIDCCKLWKYWNAELSIG